MNKIAPLIINGLIFIILAAQASIYYLNTKKSSKIFNQKNITVENFSTIVLSNSGMTRIGSEKLNKIDDNNIYLEGESYLENNDYKIYGKDISINMKREISFSNKSVEVVNSMGTLKAKGFKNFDSEGKIFFEGEVNFKSHE
jgi:archaellum component FlaF (FlaF/FlaG flagellin family)